MESFFKESGFQYLLEVFQGGGVSDFNFLTLSEPNIKFLIKDEATSLLFISKYNHLKAQIAYQINSNELPSLDLMETNEVDEISIDGVNSTDNSISTNNVTTEEFEFVENDIYRLLKSTLPGMAILGMYRQNKTIMFKEYKDIVILNELEKSLKKFKQPKISTTTFEELAELTIELFPSQQQFKDTWFETGTKVDKSEKRGKKRKRGSSEEQVAKRNPVQGHRGAFYNTYKIWRGILKKGKVFVADEPSSDEEEIPDNPRIITSDYIKEINDKVDPTEVILAWHSKFPARYRALAEVSSVRVYFDSFPHLKTELGPSMLASDFLRIFESDLKDAYSTLFVRAWPSTARDLLQHFCKAARRPSVFQVFAAPFQSRLDCIMQEKELQNQANLLALILLPGYLKYLPNNDQNFTKCNILDSFILIVQDDDQQLIENRINELKVLYDKINYNFINAPFIILCGDIENIQSCYVHVVDHMYKMRAPMEAVELCFKIYKVLNLPFSPLNIHLWSFIQKRIFQITLERGISCVNNLLLKLPASNYKTQVKKIKH